MSKILAQKMKSQFLFKCEGGTALVSYSVTPQKSICLAEDMRVTTLDSCCRAGF